MLLGKTYRFFAEIRRTLGPLGALQIPAELAPSSRRTRSLARNPVR